ncbi:MAG TPA: hypothetical protein VNL35_14590 [Chloroflexota bacterium]|nr:hypothetical protein [Chloroflexota bacterium]
MAWHASGKLLSGLVVGIAVGATVAIVVSSRAAVVLPKVGDARQGPTPFGPANHMIARARTLVDEMRTQMRQALDEGRATSARTREDLTTRFEASKHRTDSAQS